MFCGTLLALLAMDVSAGTDVISNHQLINQVVVVLSSTALIGLVANQVWPQPLEAIVGRFRAGPTAAAPTEFMPLAEACGRLFNESFSLREQALSRGKTQLSAYDWLAFWIMRKGLTIYGIRPSFDRPTPIPLDHFDVAGVRGGAAEMARDGFTTYTNLAVRRAEFEASLGALLQV